MARWVVGGVAYEVAPPSRNWTGAGTVTFKARRWRPEDHPRDRRGRFVETGAPVQISGTARGGTFQGIDAATGRVRVRVSGESRDRLVSRQNVQFGPLPAAPAPPTGQAATAKATRVARSQRDAINALKIDAPGSGYSGEAQQAAALLRAKKALTAAQTDALASAVRQAAAKPGVKNAGALERAAERLDALTANLRGFAPGALPDHGISKIDLDDVEDDQVIAIPRADGGVDVRQVAEVAKVSDGYKLTVTTPSGGTETRYIYPGTDVRLFEAATVADAVKLLDAAEGAPGKPKALYDAPDADAGKLFDQIASPAAKPDPATPPGGVGPHTKWFDHLGLSGSSAAPIPVHDLTIEGYTVADGIAWREAGRTFLVELKPGESQAEALARGGQVADLLEEVLKSVPPEKRVAHRGLALLQGSNPADSYWAATYGIPGFHSTATGQFGGTTIWGGADPKPTDLAHEFGHTVDSEAHGIETWLSQADGPVIPGQQRSWKSAQTHDELISVVSADFVETRLHPFVKPITVGKSGVTGYGQVDPREDFAESVRLWMKDRREGKVGYLPSTGENVRFSDLFPERAQILDAVMGTSTDFNTPIRERRRKEAEESILAELKTTGDDHDSVLKALTDSGLPIDEVKAAQLRAAERYAAFKKEQEAAKAAAALKAKLEAEQAEAKAKAEAEVASVTAALAAGHLKAADAKKLRLRTTLYKKKLRAQGYSEAEVAALAAAYETALLHQQLGLAAPSLPKTTPDWSAAENNKADELLDTAGKVQHPLSKQQMGIAAQAKANIAAELASRLNNPEDWEKFTATTGYAEFLAETGEKGGSFAEMLPQDRQLFLDQEVSKRVAAWALSSGDSKEGPVLMQEAIRQEFGLSAPSAPTMSQQAFESLMAKRWAQDGPFYRRVARVMYEHTQERFAQEGIKRVSVFRGMGFSAESAPQWAKTPGKRRPKLQPANSWSTQRGTSEMFAGGAHRIMMQGSFPVELVLGSALTGFGCLNEQEYVIFDADGDINIEML